MTYLTEKRFNFVGGYNTAYLMHSDDAGLLIHTITRFDNGCFMKSLPAPVGPVDLDRVLENRAKSV